MNRPEVFIIERPSDQVKETLGWMNTLAHEQKIWPDLVNLARQAVEGTYDHLQESESIRRFVKELIVFRLDPDGVEYLQAPDKTLEAKAGDCDDMACLAHALLAAIGHDCEPMGVRWEGEQGASHAVIFDITSSCFVDPVADVDCVNWPPRGFMVQELVLRRM